MSKIIGTEKEVAFARTILETLSASYAAKAAEPRGEYWAGRKVGVDFLIAIDSGDFNRAAELAGKDDFPGWVLGSYALAKRSDDPARGWMRDEPSSFDEAVIPAGNVIDVLKKDFYEASK